MAKVVYADIGSVVCANVGLKVCANVKPKLHINVRLTVCVKTSQRQKCLSGND